MWEGHRVPRLPKGREDRGTRCPSHVGGCGRGRGALPHLIGGISVAAESPLQGQAVQLGCGRAVDEGFALLAEPHQRVGPRRIAGYVRQLVRVALQGGWRVSPLI